jgi:hypothetical protein
MTWGPDCFWYWLHEHYPPNILWCEEKVCSLVVTPFNTWTNLAYLLVSLYSELKLRGHPNPLFRFFSRGAFWIGFTSLVYHASLNFFTQIFDFFGMYLFCFLLIMLNRDRSGKWPEARAGMRRFWMLVTGATAITTLSLVVHPPFPIQLYVFALILTIIVTELRAPPPPDSPGRPWFWSAAVSLLIAVTFSALDATRTMCDPQNHFWQGHGVWHLMGGAAFFCAFRHYWQVYGAPPTSTRKYS